MKKFLTKDLQPGMVVASPIYTSKGQLIADSGTILTEYLISRLTFYSIASAKIDEASIEQASGEPETPATDTPASVSIPNPSRASNPSYAQQVMAKPEFMTFQIEYSKEINAIQELFAALTAPDAASNPINTQKTLDDFSSLFSQCSTTVELFDKIHNMRQIDDSVYAHCLNVALIARMMGKWLHFSPEDLEILTLCGLLHDIGKCSLPESVLNKPDKYTDEEFVLVKQHTLFGYKILKPLALDERIKKAALMHHERCDGSGYPQGLTENDIDDFAEIIAIADVYDAMTAARSYRSPLCPFQVIAAFEKEGLQKYSPKYILTFLKRIANTYQNNRVLLNNGQSANIVMINSHNLTKPMIQLDDGTVLDMTTRSDLEITKII